MLTCTTLDSSTHTLAMQHTDFPLLLAQRLFVVRDLHEQLQQQNACRRLAKAVQHEVLQRVLDARTQLLVAEALAQALKRGCVGHLCPGLHVVVYGRVLCHPVV